MLRSQHRTTRSAAVAILVSSAVSSGAPAQSLLYVDAAAAPGGTGANWRSALNDLQSALSAAAASEEDAVEVRIAQGRYVPSQPADPKDGRSITFALPPGVTLRGGYAGSRESDPDANDPALFPTILDGASGSIRAYHVVLIRAAAGAFGLDGLTIMNGQADVVNNDTLTHLGGGVLKDGGTWQQGASLTITRCVFRDNQARFGGAIYARYGSLSIDGCEFEANQAAATGGAAGGAVRATSLTLTLRHSSFLRNAGGLGGALGVTSSSVAIQACSFEENFGSAGGGMRLQADGTIDECQFRGNVSSTGGGAHADGALRFRHCTFEENQASLGGGGLLFAPTTSTWYGGGAEITGCVFNNNTCNWFGGAILLTDASSPDPDLVVSNCLLTGNRGGEGGGILTNVRVVIVNCTVASNVGVGAMSTEIGRITAQNCIFWGNVPAQIAPHDGQPPTARASGPDVVSHCCIQGGWDGAGINNFEQDPRFLQPGCHNYRLGVGSPALDAGDASLLPTGVTLDLAGQSRVQNGAVDLGAYEGGFDLLPPVGCADGIDPGELVWLLPQGIHQPLQNAAARLINISVADNATANLTLMRTEHPPARGTILDGTMLRMATSLQDGEHSSRAYAPFDGALLNGRDPLSLDLLTFDMARGAWRLAAMTNSTNSPGHDGPDGDRYVTLDVGLPYPLSPFLGDYGVVWNAQQQRGYVWANIDHAGDFSAGAPALSCPADCAEPPDGLVDRLDITALLASWGPAAPGALTDIDHDGTVSVSDLLSVISAWGACP